MEYDLHNSVLQRVGMDTQAITTDTTTVGNIIDTAGFESLEFIVQVGTVTDGDYVSLIESGDDSGLSDAATVDPELVLGGLVFDNTGSNTAQRVGTVTKERYVRLSIVSTNTATGVDSVAGPAVLSNPHSSPTAAV